MKKTILIVAVAVITLLSAAAVFAQDLNVQDIMTKLMTQKEKVRSYEATLVTTYAGPYIEGKQVQKAKVYFQAPDKTRTDTFGQVHQVTLKLKDSVQVMDSLGNYKDLKEEMTGQNGLTDPLKLLAYVDFKAEESSPNIILTGTTRPGTADSPLLKSNISKVVFYLDSTAGSVQRAEVYNASANAFIVLTITYADLKGVFFPVKSSSIVQVPGSGVLTVETRYEQAKVNEPITDEIFDVTAIKRALAQEKEAE
jgi:outer membrane lipoprotein-sorting protein